MKRIIDLRSDTVTKPTPEMRRAMAEAEVGDDVLGDDPTVHRLERITADLLGKEAALYVPSGTMCNQIALYTATDRGDEVLCETGCHILNYEVAAPAAISGLLLRPIEGKNGILTADRIAPFIRPAAIHTPRTRMIALENTHNRAGGAIYSIENIEEIEKLGRKHELWMHLDGARLWNAHIATGVPLDRYARHFDSVSVCLSKGLGAPIGSVLLGTKGFIEKARRTRKMFGGGMRQVGIIAAAGIYALEHNLSRMEEDHRNARLLAESMTPLAGVSIDLESVVTNIVLVDLDPNVIAVDAFVQALKEAGVLCLPFGPNRVRFMTHLDVSAGDCRIAATAVGQVMGSV